MRALFSIITVTYNAADTIGRTLRSIDEQTCRLYEHIVTDGASTDDTCRIVKSHPSELRTLTSEPDRGIYDAMNRGRGEATGDYLIFLNAGDTFHSPDTLQHLADVILANDYPGIVYGQTDLVDAEGRYLGPRHLTAPEHLSLNSFAEGMVVCHQAFTVLRRIAPPFNLKYRYSADYEWCIICLQHSRHNVYLPETTIDYLAEGESTAHRAESLKERFRIMCRYYGLVPTVVRHIGFIGRFLRHKRRMKRAMKSRNE